jgi:hydroxymethylglutaryl-CoA lyase
MVKIIECPRDAMQGLEQFVPTSAKISYLNSLLKVGFDTIDFGSFVSPKAIPQMRDTAEVLAGLNLTSSSSSLLAIVANQRGATDALKHDQIDYLGYPFSISETFQQRNTNRGINEAIDNLTAINQEVIDHGKTLVAYLSMGFGNPYGDPYSLDIVKRYTETLIELNIGIISLSDTVGNAHADEVGELFEYVTKNFSGVEFGVHLHATAGTARAKVEAAFDAGCRRFDGAIKGYGGCPMAKDDLTGNVPTEVIIEVLESKGMDTGLDKKAFGAAYEASADIFQ